MNIMTYDYHGYSELRPWTQNNAPLYSVPNDEAQNQNSDFAMEYWKIKGADPAKLLIGIPAYGRGYILKDQNQFGLFAPAVGPIPKPLNISDPRHTGYWAFNEYCDRMRTEADSWTVYRVRMEKLD